MTYWNISLGIWACQKAVQETSVEWRTPINQMQPPKTKSYSNSPEGDDKTSESGCEDHAEVVALSNKTSLSGRKKRVNVEFEPVYREKKRADKRLPISAEREAVQVDYGRNASCLLTQGRDTRQGRRPSSLPLEGR